MSAGIGEVGPPSVVPLAGLPARVTVYEVGARDGLQNEPGLVPAEVKAELITRLAAAGLPAVETTSLVRPDLVPQLADAEQVLGLLPELPGVRLPVLVPNRRGLARAIDLGLKEIAVFASATESFAQRNLGTSTAGALEMFAPVVAGAREHGMAVRAYVSMAFGDPWEGAVPIPAVVKAVQDVIALGCTEISLGDTIGVATPGQVVAVLDALVAAGVPLDVLAVHFHDTYGQALANTLTAVRRGITIVDASAGGLGGCPFAKTADGGRAAGNLATEDLIWQLHGLGIETGVDLEQLVATSVWLSRQLGRPSPSRVVAALARKVSGPDLDETDSVDGAH